MIAVFNHPPQSTDANLENIMKNLIYLFIICLSAFGFLNKDHFIAWYKQIDNLATQSSNNATDIPKNPTTATGTSLSPTAEKQGGNSVQANTYAISAIRDALVNKDFKKLNSALENYQKAYEQDIANEDDVFDTYYQAFFFKGSGYEALLDEWVQSYPDHYQPYLARASYYCRMGWDARGGKFASETSDDQIESMKNFFAKANADIKTVLTKKQDNIMPYYLLININKAVGDTNSVKAIAQMAVEKCPGSFRIRSTYLLAIAPRWGGTYEEMGHFADRSQQYASINPRIALLQGYVYYEAGVEQRISKNYGKALELVDKAISFGDSALFYAERARIYQALERYDEALADISTAIDISPQDFELYDSRARIMGRKEMLQEALNDIEIAEQLSPNDEDTIKLKNWLAGKHYTRSRQAVDQKDFNTAIYNLKTAIDVNPDEIDYYRLMDWLLAKQSDWDAIIIYWNRYLERNPNDDVAYLERGGAYFHKGDLASAVEDAKQAADLGNSDGQKTYDRYKGQVRH